jgi:Mg-chelatase subunit ChlD
MSRRPRLFLSALLAGLACLLVSLSAVPTVSEAAPAPVFRKPNVEIVFCLDTTGSMTGLIDGAKLKVWAICNQILNARPMPNLRVGLVAFRDKGDEYITKVYDLRDDLDDVYADVSTFVATGGGDTPESVNQALDDAVNKIKWSEDKKTLRILFLVGDAPPHMDYTDDVKYPITCKKALDRGILINTIQCGNDADCTKYWKDIAQKALGSYVAIPQAGGIRTYSTPLDRRMSELNAELVRNTIVYGSAAKREADEKKLRLAAALPAEVAADRVGYLAKENRTAAYDLLDAIRAGKTRLESLRTEELNAEMQKMSLRDRAEHLHRVGLLRSKLLKEAFDLDRKRCPLIQQEMTRNKDSFDSQVFELLRKQTSKRMRF